MKLDSKAVRAAILAGQYDEAVRARYRVLEIEDMDRDFAQLQRDVDAAAALAHAEFASTFGTPSPSASRSVPKHQEKETEKP